MKNKVYLDNDTLESIKEEGIYPTIIELTTEDCPECYDAARSAYWSQARGVTTWNPQVFTKAFMQTRSECSWCAWAPIPA